jgi:RTX calcium-binding nonapeptide repeat (4 copies)
VDVVADVARRRISATSRLRLSSTAGADEDWLDAGSGDDVLTGGSGVDALGGHAGNDRIFARDGEKDTISCAAGNDVVDADPVEDHDPNPANACEIMNGRRSSGSSPSGDRPSGQKARRCTSRARGMPARMLAVRLSKARGGRQAPRAAWDHGHAQHRRGRQAGEAGLRAERLRSLPLRLRTEHHRSQAPAQPTLELAGHDRQGHAQRAGAPPTTPLPPAPPCARAGVRAGAQGRHSAARQARDATPGRGSARPRPLRPRRCSRARAKGPAVVQQTTASSAPDTDCYGIGHPNPDTMRLGKYAIALTPVLGPIDMLYTALNDGVHGMLVSWAIDVQPTRGGQVDTTHYGPAATPSTPSTPANRSCSRSVCR